MVKVFALEISLGLTFLGTPHHPILVGHGFRFGDIPGIDIFGDTPPPNIDQNPYPCSGHAQRRKGCHASLWPDQIPDFRIYVVTATWGPSFVPRSKFSSFFSGSPGKAQNPLWYFYPGYCLWCSQYLYFGMVAVVIILNSILLAISTDYAARRGIVEPQDLPTFFIVADCFFGEFVSIF